MDAEVSVGDMIVLWLISCYGVFVHSAVLLVDIALFWAVVGVWYNYEKKVLPLLKEIQNLCALQQTLDDAHNHLTLAMCQASSSQEMH